MVTGTLSKLVPRTSLLAIFYGSLCQCKFVKVCGGIKFITSVLVHGSQTQTDLLNVRFIFRSVMVTLPNKYLVHPGTWSVGPWAAEISTDLVLKLFSA